MQLFTVNNNTGCCVFPMYYSIIYLHPCFKYCFCFSLQAKAEKPFFSANHELDSLVCMFFAATYLINSRN